MPATPDRLRGRREALTRAVAGTAVLLTAPASVRYLSGFTGSSGWLLLRESAAHLFTDGRYRTQAPAQAPGCEIHIAETGLVSALAPMVSGIDGGLILEAEAVSLALHDELLRTPGGVDLLPQAGLVAEQRVVKDAAEVGRIRAALELTEEAMIEALSAGVSGHSEAEVAARLDFACRRRGAERMAFDTIVAAGPNGALPHARPGGTLIVPGVPVVVDCGCVLDGYCSDITRTLVVGELEPEWISVHAAVDRARRAALAAAAPGIAAAELDRVARDSLAEDELEGYFVHSLGHGVGLEIHEPPRVSARSSETLSEGMVITIEPGVYLPGRGGIRLEDMVLITADGAERLNRTGSAPLRSVE